jgi:hypothetical protein
MTTRVNTQRHGNVSTTSRTIDPGCDILCTSTGVVEAGCKVVIGTRLKRAGMHWTVNGANAIIALRCSKLSRRFEDFWERRSEHKHAAA